MNVKTEGLLKETGLTQGEIKVYLVLLEIGSTSANPIIKKTGMQRSTVYFCLDSLISKGLIGFIIKNNRKYFEANKPESLLEYLENKRKQIVEQERKIKQDIFPLFERKAKIKEEQEAKIYIGFKGILNAFFDALTAMQKGESAYVFSGALPEEVDVDTIRNLITKVRIFRARKKVNLKVIYSEDLKNTIGKDQEKTHYTKVKYLPKNMTSPAIVNIYGNTTLIILWSKNPIAFSIKNKEIADTFMSYFEFMWKLAKK